MFSSSANIYCTLFHFISNLAFTSKNLKKKKKKRHFVVRNMKCLSSSFLYMVERDVKNTVRTKDLIVGIQS